MSSHGEAQEVESMDSVNIALQYTSLGGHPEDERRLITAGEIRVALNEFRAHIMSQNRRALEIYVPFIANAQPAAPGDFEDEEEIAEIRLDALAQIIVGDCELLKDHGVAVPSDVLDRFDELAPRFGWDGVLVLHEPEEERARKRNEYFDTVEQALKEKSLQEVREMISIPDDFRILAEHVDGLLGAGMEMYHGRHQLMFWWGLVEDNEAYAARVKTPEKLSPEAGLHDQYEIAGGWNAGEGPDGDCCVVYCRTSKEDPWGWIYVVSTEYGTEIFETIPELLKWYAGFRQPDLGWMPEFNEEDVFSGSGPM